MDGHQRCVAEYFLCCELVLVLLVEHLDCQCMTCLTTSAVIRHTSENSLVKLRCYIVVVEVTSQGILWCGLLLRVANMLSTGENRLPRTDLLPVIAIGPSHIPHLPHIVRNARCKAKMGV